MSGAEAVLQFKEHRDRIGVFLRLECQRIDYFYCYLNVLHSVTIGESCERGVAQKLP